MVLPNGLIDFDGLKYFTSSTIKTLVCNEELLTFDIGGCDYLREIRFNEGLTSILGVVALPLLHELTIPSSIQTIGYLSLNHLYSLTISQGAPKTLSSYSIRSLPRLVAMFDHRDKAGRNSIPLPATVLYTEENESDFRLVQDGDFLLVKDTEEYLLLDYYGTSFEVTIPSAFHDGEKEITSFRMFDSFCYSGILSGGERQAFEDEEILLHEHFIAKLFVPSSLTAIVQTTRQRYYTEDIYFDMSEEEALSRFNGSIANYFLQPEMWLRLYYKAGEEYVRFF